MSEEVPAPAPTAIEREIAYSEKWGDWDRAANLRKKIERTKQKIARTTERMTKGTPK